MHKPQLPVQIVDASSGDVFEELHLDWTPHPGHWLEVDRQLYTVLEKRHYYQLRHGKYQLCAIRAFVRPAATTRVDLTAGDMSADLERSLLNGEWAIGDRQCRFNARSPLLRCAVNPLGPCAGCTHFEPLLDAPRSGTPDESARTIPNIDP